MTITVQWLLVRCMGPARIAPNDTSVKRVAPAASEAAEPGGTAGTLRAMTEAHLTQQALERLREELEWRAGEHRREISRSIERAREMGDITENADYDAAKDEQGKNEARIRQLERLIRTAVVVEGASGEVVEPGCLVELRHEGDDAPQTYFVGSIEERHQAYDVLSTNSPLGQALLGAAPGSTVTYQGPRRELSVTVVSVRPLG
jgi:transcription elongation factor GreA